MNLDISLSRRVMVFLAIAAGLLNTLPSVLTYFIAGDIIPSFMFIQCYGEQLWQGNFYPRWCMNANGGYGSPGPIFYFPLPFMFTSLVYPLRYFGMEIRDIYFFGMWQVSFATFLVYAYWLRSYTTHVKAAICAFVFLWLSYRMEVFASRSSYAEAWCIALMPLLFMQLRKLIDGANNWPQLALVIVILMLCHAPVTLIGLMACGFLVLFQRPKALLTLALATGLAYGATLFHWQAAKMFADTLHPFYGGISFWKQGWVNWFADDIQLFAGEMLEAQYMKIRWLNGITVIAMFIFAFWLCFKANIPSLRDKKEVRIWLFIMFFALFMLFSISTPVWKLIIIFSEVKTPWRMISLFMFAFIVLLAIASNHVWDILSRTRKMLAALFVSALMLLGSVMLQSNPNKNTVVLDVAFYTQEVFAYFNTRWTGVDFVIKEAKKFYIDFILFPPASKAYFVESSGKVDIKGWGYDGIKLHAERDKPGTVKIEHLYNPMWHATINEKPVELGVEKDSLGRMLVNVPAGKNEIAITLDATKALPLRYRWICLGSLVSFLIILAGNFRVFFINKRMKAA